MRLRNFGGGVLLCLMIAGCVVVTESRIQETVEKVVRYERESLDIMENLRIRTSANAVALNFFDIDFRARIRFLETGDPAFQVERAYIDSSSIQEILEYVSNGEVWWVEDIANMESGILKNSLIKSDIDAVIAVGIYDDTGEVVGYLAASWKVGNRPPNSVIVSEFLNAAEEITRRNGIL